jgi:AraC-like DNA-binding protein
MNFEETIPWIPETPLGIRMRQIDYVHTHRHEDVLEIIFCLRGSVKFSYAYEEFTLEAGDFISVDKDAHFLFDGTEDNISVSFYIDLKKCSEKYPYLTSLLFVCESTKAVKRMLSQQRYSQLKGRLIALLYYYLGHEATEPRYIETIQAGTDRIVSIFINNFDIIYYYNLEANNSKQKMERYREMMVYFHTHFAEKVTLESMASHFNLSSQYVSELQRATGIGFRKSLQYTRANQSQKLLLETTMNITEISESCGFSDPKYYYQAFKAWYKCTPREFRKIYNSEIGDGAKETDISGQLAAEPLATMMKAHYLSIFLQ